MRCPACKADNSEENRFCGKQQVTVLPIKPKGSRTYVTKECKGEMANGKII